VYIEAKSKKMVGRGCEKGLLVRRVIVSGRISQPAVDFCADDIPFSHEVYGVFPRNSRHDYVVGVGIMLPVVAAGATTASGRVRDLIRN